MAQAVAATCQIRDVDAHIQTLPAKRGERELEIGEPCPLLYPEAWSSPKKRRLPCSCIG